MPLFGYALFAIYMRWFLTPVSAMSWANLNHTLCGCDNDPFYVILGSNKYFYLFADGYLGLISVGMWVVNYVIVKAVIAILTSMGMYTEIHGELPNVEKINKTK